MKKKNTRKPQLILRVRGRKHLAALGLQAGTTVLHLVAGSKGGKTSIAELLLQAKASVGVRDRQGNTPLHLAAAAGNFKTLRLLLDCDAAINAENK